MSDAIKKITEWIANNSAARAAVEPVSLAPQPATMAPYDPSLREKLSGVTAEMLMNASLAKDNYEAQELGGKLTNLAEFSPLGMVTAADDFNRAGDMPTAALAALGMVPGVGKEARAAGEAAQAGIKAFHGSPHSFDRFALDKINTGEGAQVYGHGLYFAENEDVARSYRDALSKSSLGSMYEVNIAADPDKFLDWDAPITAESPQAIRDALNKIANSSDPEIKKKLYEQVGQPGSMFYSVLGDAAKTGDYVKNQSAATQALKDAGISGIKYKDAGSRFGHGEGTRNYVVFDENLVNIVKKYGIGTAVAAGLVSAEMAQQMKDQGEI